MNATTDGGPAATRTVATAGHVDHGKSSLVLALTGTDPDRLVPEKARGLTIDLGFAFTTLPSGLEVGFVDVPGHVRFLKNMLAGVGAVEVAVLVVAATEGWMPQSEEHLRILELLGVRHGVVALTKADLVDDETLAVARLELDERLASSPLARAPVVTCDSRSGRGLAELAEALDAVLVGTPAPADRGRPRLWIDRVFSARGAGTVVTGTLAGGALAVDTEVVVGPDRRPARIRGIETHHRRLDRAWPGSRVALNLAGIEHRHLRRGDALVTPGRWVFPTVVDVELCLDHRPPRRGTVHAHVGSGELGAHLRLLDDSGRFARLRLERPVPLAPDDRLVLRDPGPERTLGGAEVLDVAPAGRARDAPQRLALPLGRRLLAGHPWLGRETLARLGGLAPREAENLARELVAGGEALEVGGHLVDPAVLGDVHRRAREVVSVRHRDAPLDAGVELPELAGTLRIEPDRLRAALARDPDLVVERGVVRRRSHRVRAADSAEGRHLLDAVAATPFSPPSPAEAGVDAAVARALVREGALVDLDGILFGPDALEEARERVRGALAGGGTLTVADVRDLLGSTRRYVLAILARLDAEGVTRRRGDERLAGPAGRRSDDG